MDVKGDRVTVTSPVTRPRGRLHFVLPLLLAAGVGVTAGASPHTALIVTAAVVSAVVLTVRLEWAALAVICTAVFEDYLDLLSPWAHEWLVLLLVIAWAVRRAQGPLHEHRLLTTTVPAAVFAAVLVLSTALHPNGYTGAVVVGRYAELLVVLLVLADTLAGPLAPHRAARFYVWSCVAAAGLRARHRGLLGVPPRGRSAGALRRPGVLAAGRRGPARHRPHPGPAVGLGLGGRRWCSCWLSSAPGPA